MTFTPIANSEFGEEINPGVEISQQDSQGNVRNYKVFYSETGGTTVRAVDANGQLLQNVEPIYKDGVWDQSKLTKDTASSFSKDDQLRIHQAIQESTKNHIDAVAPGLAKPKWTTQEGYANGIPSDKDAQQEVLENKIKNARNNKEKVMYTKKLRNYNKSKTNQGETEKKDSLLDKITNQGSRGVGAIENAFSGAEEADTLFKKIVKYPMDMSNSMDHMFIQCYSYRAPYAAALDGKSGKRNILAKDKESSFTFGSERTTPYKRKLGAGIKLPMPNNMTDGNPRNWGEQSMDAGQMGAIQNVSKNVLTSFFTNDFGGYGRTATKLSMQGEMLTQESTRGMSMANKIAQLASESGFGDVSSEQVLSRSVGVVVNSNTELLFAGVSLRSFEYQWLMSPRNRLEAANVRMIIRAFKQWSAPKKIRKIDNGELSNVGKAGGPSFFLGTPNIFRLRFVTNGNRNILGVNKFKPCALQNVDINYTPEGQWMAYENGMPISVMMTLRFAELEPIYDTDYSEDIAKDRQYDPNDPESIGDLMPISIIKQNSPYSSDIGY
ncbi:MAG: hypothetical protein CMB29_01785 [Euryarchaeota archaeon]|nr:hypothetical protein [Euryarchaeota archaeon]|tara:strand:+ start:2866 stop:4518 length:1653 start_codon:yes stop_codon:yes gene_type:complete